MKITKDAFMVDDGHYRITLDVTQDELEKIRSGSVDNVYRHTTYFTTNNSIIRREIISPKINPQKDDIITLDDIDYRVLYRKWGAGGIDKIRVTPISDL